MWSRQKCERAVSSLAGFVHGGHACDASTARSRNAVAARAQQTQTEFWWSRRPSLVLVGRRNTIHTPGKQSTVLHKTHWSLEVGGRSRHCRHCHTGKRSSQHHQSGKMELVSGAAASSWRQQSRAGSSGQHWSTTVRMFRTRRLSHSRGSAPGRNRSGSGRRRHESVTISDHWWRRL